MCSFRILPVKTRDPETEASVTIRHQSLAWVDPILVPQAGSPHEPAALGASGIHPSGIGILFLRIERPCSSGPGKLEPAAFQGFVKMVSLDGQRTERRLSNLALIAPSPIRRAAKPTGLAPWI